MTGELLGQVHGLLADAEELLEAGVEAGVVRCEANIEQVRVQTLDLEHDGADVLGARRDMNALDEQAEVARLVGGNVQRAHGDERGLLALGVGQELVVFHVTRGSGTEAVIHGVLAQRVQAAGPVIGQHQAATIGQTLGDQAEHIAQLALAPHAGGDKRRHGRERHLGGIDLGAHGHPAGVLPLHGDDVVHGVTAAQAALIVADDHGNPAVALVIQVVDGLGQLVLLDGNRQHCHSTFSIAPGTAARRASTWLSQRRAYTLFSVSIIRYSTSL